MLIELAQADLAMVVDNENGFNHDVCCPSLAKNLLLFAFHLSLPCFFNESYYFVSFSFHKIDHGRMRLEGRKTPQFDH